MLQEVDALLNDKYQSDNEHDNAKLEALLNEAVALGVPEDFLKKKLDDKFIADQKATAKASEQASLSTVKHIHSVMEGIRMAAKVFDAPKLETLLKKATDAGVL